jgi:urease accessory protein
MTIPVFHGQSRAPVALSGVSALAAFLLAQPSQAHGIAHGGVAAGFLHPITGTDHLLLLIGVGAAASCLSSRMLLWALAGGVVGGCFGVMGLSLPAQESLAALAITAVAGLVLVALREGRTLRLGLGAAVVACAVAVHALLHGPEAPADGSAALWWLGAALASCLVSGGSFIAFRRLPHQWTGRLALLLAIFGGVAALVPVVALIG